MDRETVVRPRRGDHGQRLHVRIVELAVRRDHVVLRADPFEVGVVHVALAAVMRHLEHVHFDPALFVHQPGLFEALQRVVAAAVAGEEDALAVGLGQDHDAREVVDRAVDEGRGLGAGLFVLPFEDLPDVAVPVLLQREQVLLARGHDLELEVFQRDRLLPGPDEPLEGRVSLQLQRVEQVAEVAPLVHAREDQRALGLQQPSQRRRAHRRGGRADRYVVVVQQVVERVVPEALDLPGQRLPRVAELLHPLHHFQDAGDVIAVDVADHRELDLQRLAVREPALLADLLEARLQRVGPDAGRTAVDHREQRLRLGAEVEEERVPEPRAQGFQHQHRGYTDCRARSASSMPAPWK